MSFPIRTTASELMTTGGDARVTIDPETGLNRYFSAPHPRDVIAYASSTANDISEDAYAHVEQVLAEIGPELSAETYADRLEALRGRILRAYRLDDDVAVVFAPSGTDLEYAALALVKGRGPCGTNAVLLGADEVGSGCVHSAQGLYFAEETALGMSVTPREPVAGLGGASVDLIDVPVRDEDGRVCPSATITQYMDRSIAAASVLGRDSLVHIVHGSKTGLVLPSLEDIDALARKHGNAVTFVLDACQARITSRALAGHLARGMVVLMTGSKFMGGPPFSGFALVPPGLAAGARRLPEGFNTIFRRAEWPADWPGAEVLEESANVGLLLRLEAAIFELERFQRLPGAVLRRVILSFHAAVRSEIVTKTAARRVAPYPVGGSAEAETNPIEMRTLSTLDLGALVPGGASFDDAREWHKAMALGGVRVGQPVKCVRLPDGRWGATLRIGLTMAQVCDAAGLSDEQLARHFVEDMASIREAILAAAGQPGMRHQAA